jgi:hypothetical protein
MSGHWVEIGARDTWGFSPLGWLVAVVVMAAIWPPIVWRLYRVWNPKVAITAKGRRLLRREARQAERRANWRRVIGAMLIAFALGQLSAPVFEHWRNPQSFSPKDAPLLRLNCSNATGPELYDERRRVIVECFERLPGAEPVSFREPAAGNQP